jgi:hypothetical protein
VGKCSRYPWRDLFPELLDAGGDLLHAVRGIDPIEVEVVFGKCVRDRRAVEVGLRRSARDGESVERSRRKQERRKHVGDTFHFHGNANGVFGCHNTVSGNSFHSSGVADAWVLAALTAALDLSGRVGTDVAGVIQDAHDELQRAGNDGGRIRRAAGKLASLAEAVGDVGVPLLRAANEILRAIPG